MYVADASSNDRRRLPMSQQGDIPLFPGINMAFSIHVFWPQLWHFQPLHNYHDGQNYYKLIRWNNYCCNICVLFF